MSLSLSVYVLVVYSLVWCVTSIILFHIEGSFPPLSLCLFLFFSFLVCLHVFLIFVPSSCVTIYAYRVIGHVFLFNRFWLISAHADNSYFLNPRPLSPFIIILESNSMGTWKQFKHSTILILIFFPTFFIVICLFVVHVFLLFFICLCMISVFVFRCYVCVCPPMRR